MKDLKSITKQLGSKKDLEVNLPMYSSRMLDLYNKFSQIKLSMNYYTVNEVFGESDMKDTYIGEIFSKINGIIKSGIAQDGDVFDGVLIQQTDTVRNDIIKHMEVVTSYVDKFQIYEYVMNRIEYRFDEEEFSSEYYENRFTNDIMHYIIKDKETVNAKISEIIAQLPIRITKAKFYERIREAFTLYREGNRDSLDEFVYMLRTVSMLYEPQGFTTDLPELFEIYNSISKVEFKDITKEAYDEIHDKLKYAVDRLTHISDMYVMIEELVNDLYVVLLTKPYAFEDDNKINNLKDNIALINAYALGESDELDIDIVTQRYTEIEGKQEEIYSLISSSDFIIDDYKKDDILNSLMLDKQFKILELAAKLTSSSIFIKLVSDKTGEEPVTEEYIDETFAKLVNELDNLFEGMPVIVRRAVMSNVIAALPNFFKNIDELQSYINVSLSQCNDVAERRACVSLIKQIFESVE